MKTIIWFFPFGTLRGRLFNYGLAAIYGGLTAFGTALQIIRKRKTFFQFKERPEPPKCLFDKNFGEHNYIQCKVNNFLYIFLILIFISSYLK